MSIKTRAVEWEYLLARVSTGAELYLEQVLFGPFIAAHAHAR